MTDTPDYFEHPFDQLAHPDVADALTEILGILGTARVAWTAMCKLMGTDVVRVLVDATSADAALQVIATTASMRLAETAGLVEHLHHLSVCDSCRVELRDVPRPTEGGIIGISFGINHDREEGDSDQ